MDLTPEERSLRDYYLNTKGSTVVTSFELFALVIGIAAFPYGFFGGIDGRAMIFTGFVLVATAASRFLFSGANYEKKLISLIKKYEEEISSKK